MAGRDHLINQTHGSALWFYGFWPMGKPSSRVRRPLSQTDRAQRKPTLLNLAIGFHAFRLAVRFSSGSAFHAPPRATFIVPRSGPVGFLAGARA